MFCRKCGAQNDDNAFRCVKCGEVIQPEALGASPRQPGMPAGGYAEPPAPVQNYLVFAILVTLFCCLPGGIVAIVYASQVNSKMAAGDYDGAMQASSNAKTWCIISLVVGLIVSVIWVALGGMKNF